MLDTNICSFIIREKPKHIKEILKSIDAKHTVVLSSIVVSELLYGAKKSANQKLIKIVSDFIDNFLVYEFGKISAKVYAQIRTDLEEKGNIIGSHDLFIASHAKSLNAILVTNNTKEFSRVEGLILEDWSIT
jgi:tRNA(fMet)-specific endonuclease VapC